VAPVFPRLHETGPLTLVDGPRVHGDGDDEEGPVFAIDVVDQAQADKRKAHRHREYDHRHVPQKGAKYTHAEFQGRRMRGRNEVSHQ